VIYCVCMIDRDSATPLYAQLADLIRTQIRTGELTSRVPSVRTLVQEHELSHMTVSKALDLLKDEGLIVSAKGKGYYVVGGKP
jgi:DNA-binding GntR family transcriptional regulator